MEEENHQSCCLTCKTCYKKFLYHFIGFIETKFQKHGERVAEHPWKYILFMFLFVFGMFSGFVNFRQERNPLRLWIPQDSDFFSDTNWLMEEYGEGLRTQTILITAPDVLQANVLNQLLNIHMKLVNSTGLTLGTAWEDVCFKVPIISFNVDEPRIRRELQRTGKNLPNDEDFDAVFNQSFFKESNTGVSPMESNTPSILQMMTDETFDPSTFLGSSLYCSIVKNMALGCLQQSMLDLWRFDETIISNLTKAEIVNKINSVSVRYTIDSKKCISCMIEFGVVIHPSSPTLGHPLPFKTLLGGVTHGENNTIVSAKALLSLYMVHINFSTVNMDEVGNDGGTADWANGPGLEWESNFLKIMQEAAETSVGMKVYYEAGRSFGDVSSSGMFQDMDKLVIGIALMLIYIQINQTKRSCVESRIIPSIVGLLCVGLAFLSASGICSLFGAPYGPVHTSLPFLLLGIGVDDMFVILSCWNGLSPSERTLPIPQRMGLTMRHAGLSITITSATDFVAFMIGSSTILPSLQSFCLYAAVGVAITFFLQSTLFVAALTLDQKRLEGGRNFLLPFLRHTPPKLINVENSSQSSYGLHVIYSKFIITRIGKVAVLLITGIFLGMSIVGNINMRQEFRPEWFLDQNSYLSEFLEKRDEFYPDHGNSASVYFGQLQYSEELQKIGRLVEQLHNESAVLMDVQDWWSGFHRYVNHHFKKDIKVYVLSVEEFNQYISQYLFSPHGSRYQKNFHFAEPLECNKPAPNITVSSIDVFFWRFGTSAQNVAAMNTMKTLARNANFTTGDKFVTVWSKLFANWVTDEVISEELIRNICWAMVAVGLTTCVLLGSGEISLSVLLCVFLTLVNTTGFMHFWGLTIDIVSCIALVLAVGLCVDFAAHIGYAFMCAEGTRNDRAVFAVSYIGGAVIHGGATTLLALSVLVFSHSYIFTAFFKIFLLVILMGLFHGLVFLPVFLSMLGPNPYPDRMKKIKNNINDNEEIDVLEDLTSSGGRGKEGRGL